MDKNINHSLNSFPDHTTLPDSDNCHANNFQGHFQSILLTDSIYSALQKIHPDGQYIIGQDCGIYWRKASPLEQGAESPDWFYVPDIPVKLDDQMRRFYVLWQELKPPLIILEFAIGDGSEEHDRTSLPQTSDSIKPGKFWVYEQIIKAPYYGIYNIREPDLIVYQLTNNSYQKITVNNRGHFPITELGVELGLWEGAYQNQSRVWLRWWNNQGVLLLTGAEKAQRAEQACKNSIVHLRKMGLTIENIAEAFALPIKVIQNYDES
jgi:Uma2 family endonuclease